MHSSPEQQHRHMTEELTPTEARLVQANKHLRNQNQDLAAENDDLQLRCEKLQGTVNHLLTELAGRRDRSLDELALVRRAESPYAIQSELQTEPAAPRASTRKAFEDVAEILSEHSERMGKLESRIAPCASTKVPSAALPDAANFASSIKHLERRVASLEAQTNGASGSATEPGKQDKNTVRALDQLRASMQRVENREKHEREIDMADTRERLYELFQHLSRNENDDQEVRHIGPFEGTYYEFLTLRDRVVYRLAGLEAYDKAFMEAKLAAHKARAR